MAGAVIESALLFGRTKSLVGVLSDPGAGLRRPGARGVVILNAGVLHRVGPSRVHVQLARALAEAGFPVLRFDLSGIGDSPPREGAETFAASSMREIGEAFAVLEATRHVSQFLVVGICSGADNGLRVALQEPRVVGAALIDGYNLPNIDHTLHLYGRRALSPKSWVRLALGRSELWSALWRHLSAPRSEKPVQTRLESMLPTPGEYVQDVRALADRGVHLLLAYTGQSPAYFNYRRLIRKRVRSWPSRERVSTHYLEDSDHVFTLLASRRRLMSLVSEWARAIP